MQMRAYVSVEIGTASHQNTATGFKFEARPLLINSGQTPARNFAFVAKAAILDVPLSEDFNTTVEIPAENGKGVIPPHQNRHIYAVVDNLVPDDQVQNIMDGTGKSLYVWGAVTYDDIFDGHWRTEFCQQLTFIPNRDGNGHTINGLFIGNRNKET